MKKSRIYILFSLLFLFIPSVALTQSLQTIYDGRTEVRASMPSNADVQLIKRYALPKARQAWRNSEVCNENFEVVDVTNGSFTKANSTQRAVLYRFCTTGHDFANNGIIVIEDRSVVAHVIYAGGEDYSIQALSDINGNGLSEIILSDGATHQGYSESVATIIEVSSTGVKNFGIADVYEDDCGAKDPCKTITHKILVKPGQTPIFYRETYRMKNKRWTKVGSAVRYSLRKDESSYKLLN